MDAQLAKFNLSYARIAAVDGDSKGLSREIDALGARVLPHRRRQLSGREIGCYLSHLKAFEALEASGAAAAIILEDDVILDVKFKRAVQALAARFSTEPVVVKMETWKKKRLGFVASRLKGFELIFAPHALTETGAYFITSEAARQLRRELIAIQDAYDDALYKHRSGLVDVLTLSPPVARQSAQFLSMIEPGRTLMKGQALRRPVVLRELFRPLAQCADVFMALLVTNRRFGWLAMAGLRRRNITIEATRIRPQATGATVRNAESPSRLARSFLHAPQALGSEAGLEG